MYVTLRSGFQSLSTRGFGGLCAAVPSPWHSPRSGDAMPSRDTGNGGGGGIMQREQRVTVQGPVKKQQPDIMSHRGDSQLRRGAARALVVAVVVCLGAYRMRMTIGPLVPPASRKRGLPVVCGFSVAQPMPPSAGIELGSFGCIACALTTRPNHLLGAGRGSRRRIGGGRWRGTTHEMHTRCSRTAAPLHTAEPISITERHAYSNAKHLLRRAQAVCSVCVGGLRHFVSARRAYVWNRGHTNAAAAAGRT